MNKLHQRTLILTILALLAFAANSLLCRAALTYTSIDAASFTSVRILSGALTFFVLVKIQGGYPTHSGNWLSAFALFVYAAGFSFSYLNLTAATGALILFGAVQITMISYGLFAGERMHWLQITGLMVACGGLAGLLLPGIATPPLVYTLLMLGAGIAWGVYSLLGKGAGDPLRVTGGNFIRAAPMALMLSLALMNQASWDIAGIKFAFLSGALASGAGYALWYAILPYMKTTTAATIQLGVPMLVALGGVLFLQEPLTLRLIIASIAIIGGIAFVVLTHEKNSI